MRAEVWRTLLHAARRNPRALKASIHMTSLFAHAGPFTRSVVAEIDRQIALEGGGRGSPGARLPIPAKVAAAVH